MPKDLEKIKKYVAWLKKADNAYFNTGKPIASDDKYDRVKKYIQDNDPKNPYLKKVGHKPKSGKKVKLPYYMPSLDKIYPDRGAEAFLKSSSGDFSVLYKLDGVSVLAINQNGETKLYTRGNGSVGQDITKLLPYIKGVGTLKKKEAVRGELMIKLSDFNAKFSKDFENPRNTVSGVANSDKIKTKVAKSIDFVAHEFVFPVTKWKEARVKLKSRGFLTTPTKQFNNPTITQLTKYLKDNKTKIYDIDGIVLIDNKTGSRISFKVNAPAVDAVVKTVNWQLSKHGILKPVIILEKPIKLSGVSITRVTGHNAKTIQDLGIGQGAIIKVTRGGDVIPRLDGVVRKAKKVELPANFKWNKTNTEAVATNLSKSDKSHIKVKKLTEAFRILGFDGIRSATAKVLIDNDYDLIDTLLGDEEDFLDIGVGNANSTKLYSGIQKAKKKASHGKLMWASHIWPSGFTDTRFDKILSVVPYKQLVRVDPKKLIQKISRIHGFSTATSVEFVKYLPDYIDFVDNLGWKIKDQSFTTESSKLAGKSFVFSGIRDKNLEEEIKKHGGIVSGSISKTTTAVIVKSVKATSTKIQKARELKVDVIGINEVKSRYGI